MNSGLAILNRSIFKARNHFYVLDGTGIFKNINSDFRCGFYFFKEYDQLNYVKIAVEGLNTCLLIKFKKGDFNKFMKPIWKKRLKDFEPNEYTIDFCFGIKHTELIFQISSHKGYLLGSLDSRRKRVCDFRDMNIVHIPEALKRLCRVIYGNQIRGEKKKLI